MLNRPDRAIILAAGVGSRLRWLTTTRPKALMPIAGEVAIIHTIRHLVVSGVRHIVINLHHHGDQIAERLADGRQFGVSIDYSWESNLLDSGGGVRRACSLLPAGKNLWVCNADVVTDVNLQPLWQQMHHHDAGAVLALVSNPTHHPKGDFTLIENRVGLRCKNSVSWTYSGVSLWSQQVVETDAWGDVFSLVKPMHRLIEQEKLYGVIHQGQWRDIGRPRDLFATAGWR
ncbi:MAG: nucleotidyltransferase family protein [Mariprofundales bacterium]